MYSTRANPTPLLQSPTGTPGADVAALLNPFSKGAGLYGSHQCKAWMLTKQGKGVDDDAALADCKKFIGLCGLRLGKDTVDVARLQVELAPTTGKYHVQGAVKFNRNFSRKALFRLFDEEFWCDRARDIGKCLEYCSKEESAVAGDDCKYVYGEYAPPRQGERTDIQRCVDFIKECGASDMIDRDIKKQLLERFPEVFMKYGMKIDETISLYRKPQTVEVLPRDKMYKWQQDAMDLFATEPGDREVYFMVDKIGNVGKTTLCRWLMQKGDLIMLSGQVKDMAYVLSQNTHAKIVAFNVVRTMAENVQHLIQFAENIKDQVLISTKYNSNVSMIRKMHVVFFVNSLPEKLYGESDGKPMLSLDRIRVWNVYKDGYEVIMPGTVPARDAPAPFFPATMGAGGGAGAGAGGR